MCVLQGNYKLSATDIKLLKIVSKTIAAANQNGKMSCTFRMSLSLQLMLPDLYDDPIGGLSLLPSGQGLSLQD